MADTKQYSVGTTDSEIVSDLNTILATDTLRVPIPQQNV